MATWKKALLGLTLVAVLAALLAVVLVKVYVTPERVRTMLQTGLEESLQRKVELGSLDVGLFSGIRLSRLAIAEKSGKEMFLQAENIAISYDLPAILKGNLMLGDILITDPQVRLVRNMDGSLNISDLLAGPQDNVQQSSSQAAEPVPSSAENDSIKSLPFLIKEFHLKNGSLIFIDRTINPASPYLYRLEGVDLAVQDFSFDQPFEATLNARLNDASLTADIRYALETGLEELQLHSDRIDVVPFLPYLKDMLPGHLGQGRLSTELQVRFVGQTLVVRGQVVVDDVDLTLNLDPPLHWREVRLALDNDLQYSFSDKVLEAKKALLEINGAQFSYQGKVALESEPLLAGNASVTVGDLRNISELLPLELREQFASYGAAGNVRVNAQLEGPAQGVDVVRHAELVAKELQANLGAYRPELSGSVNYADARVQGEGLNIDIKGQRLVANLSADKIFADTPNINLAIRADSLNLDALQGPDAGSQSAADGPDTNAPAPAAVPKATSSTDAFAGPVLLPFSGRTDFSFAELVAKGITLQNVKGYALHKDGRLEVPKMTAQMDGGALELNAEVLLSEAALPFKGQYQINDIALGPVTDALLPEGKGSTHGQLIAAGHFSGQAAAADLVPVLETSGKFDLRDGEIKGSPLFAELAKFLTNPEFEVLGFSRFHGVYGLKGGQGTIDASLESHRAVLVPKGSFSLAGPLNLSLETRVSPEVMAEAGIGGKGADLMKDDQGWSLFPLKVKGTYTSPRFTIDSAVARKQLKKGVTRELGREIEKKLGIQPDQKGNNEVQKLLDGTLKKLFGQ